MILSKVRTKTIICQDKPNLFICTTQVDTPNKTPHNRNCAIIRQIQHHWYIYKKQNKQKCLMKCSLLFIISQLKLPNAYIFWIPQHSTYSATKNVNRHKNADTLSYIFESEKLIPISIFSLVLHIVFYATDIYQRSKMNSSPSIALYI